MKFSRRRDIVISTDPGKRAKVGCSRLLGDHELLWTHEGMLTQIQYWKEEITIVLLIIGAHISYLLSAHTY